MPAPVERRTANGGPRWVSTTPEGDRVPTTARDAERLVELRSSEPGFRRSVEALASVLQKPNRVGDPEVLADPLTPEMAWVAAEAIQRVQVLDRQVRVMRRLNHRGAVDIGHVRHLVMDLRDAERMASSFLGQTVTGDAFWKRGGPEKVEEREALLDRYGPRTHEMTAPARSRDA